MRQRYRSKRRPQGFTLIDMLVSMALVIFIMVILTQAFVAGMDTFRQLKTIGDMQEKLRAVASVLRADLRADHFEGKKRLSDLNLWFDGPPREGYFRIFHGGPSILEGTDGDNINSYMAPNPKMANASGGHALQFTVKRRANQRDQFSSVGMSAFNPNTNTYQTDLASPLFQAGFGPDTRFQSPGTYATQWYEVVYFLVSLGEQTPGGTPRYALYRQQRLLVAQNQQINYGLNPVPLNANTSQEYTEISTSTANPATNMYLNSPADVTIPDRRLGGLASALQPISPTWTPLNSAQAIANPLYGSDLLITDVISFNVRVLFAGYPDFIDLQDLSTLTIPNPTGNPIPIFINGGPQNNYPFPANPAIYDTWTKAVDNLYDYSGWSDPTQPTKVVPSQPFVLSPLAPNGNYVPTRIVALQISIRVWDLKSQQARQITIVQDM